MTPEQPRSVAARHRQHRRPFFVCLLASLIAISLATANAQDSTFGFVHFGNFKRMMHRGETDGQVHLSELRQTPGNWGVGALAGLAGEIVQVDGRLLVSRGTDNAGRIEPPAPDDRAVLFAGAQVQQWIDIIVPVEMTQEKFQAFVLEQAAKSGLSLNAPFPFRVAGRLPQLTWHVVTGRSAARAHGGAGHSPHANSHAGMRVFEQPGASGTLIGIYSAARLEGVVTHPGELFHLHYANEPLTVSGHVDAYAIASGAILKLPVR